MSPPGFGKNSGPSFPPRIQTLFGGTPTADVPPPGAAITTTTASFSPSESQPLPPTLQLQPRPRTEASPPRVPKQIPFDPVDSAMFSAAAAAAAANTGTVALSKPFNSHAQKRTRSPPVLSSDRILSIASDVAEDDSEREIRAKAKRLARFGPELVQSGPNIYDSKGDNASSFKNNQHYMDATKVIVKETRDLLDGDVLPDIRESTTVIVGLCQDMCPESERDERERKGDLDQYERLDGERNQTSESLAVKKYTRTAEREAHLIRPMPVLQKTIDYLLHLMDQTYNEKFLGMYNFLWDRMRAIRMDLRMQHIFNLDAITMLEQMIRLHIIAMHELCDYKKGEGFSEGFDAHLNIEQMNKASVELFQMYDDHRKKGIRVDTEKEFRGYYALLKLDKHPGYKVEPAELSLDLAKMTPEIRCSTEILFARDVARACRIGNFVAFFRLAKKATYLQACLMHAHFAKLRTQAFASLHSGLQNNQGIPIAHVVKWLAMEGEDIESLLEYHGFSIKNFEDVYMVKEGQFLNGDVDYPTKCSMLVHQKKSKRIVDDILCKQILPGSSNRKMTVSNLTDEFTHRTTATPPISGIRDKSYEFDKATAVPSALETRDKSMYEKMGIQSASDLKHNFASNMVEFSAISAANGKAGPQRVDSLSCDDQIRAVDEEMQDSEDEHILMRQHQHAIHYPSPSSSVRENEIGMAAEKCNSVFLPRGDSSTYDVSPVDDLMIEPDGQIDLSRLPQKSSVLTQTVLKEPLIHLHASAKSTSDFMMVNASKPMDNLRQNEDLMLSTKQSHQAEREKLKMIIRKWKHQASKRREIREQRELLASMALSSISLGPPIRHTESQLNFTSGKLNIDFIMKERDGIHRNSWSRLNIAGVVGPILSLRNPNSSCLCWKLVLCLDKSDTVQSNHLASAWLQSKLMGRRKGYDNDLVFSSSELSIWRSMVDDYLDYSQFLCFSIIKEVLLGDNRLDASSNSMIGAHAIVYLISERTSWDVQRINLHRYLMSVRPGSRLPLLVLSCDCSAGTPDPSLIINRLGLHDADRTKINEISVIFLSGGCPAEHFCGFFSDDKLREGLQWLAKQSTPPPSLHLVKTRELILCILSYSMDLLSKSKISEVSADCCITIFNEALDKSAEQVRKAAHMNPNCWPCPEVDVLRELGIDRVALDAYLPKTGWSSTTQVDPIVQAIQDCKLPSFPDVSWLRHGFHLKEEALQQKSSLAEALVTFLTQSAKIMHRELAVREADLMLQKCAALEISSSRYCIIPKWEQIFQRIYNWRLMKLTRKDFSHAYVLKDNVPLMAEPVCFRELTTFSKSIEEDDGQLYPTLRELTLDEMIDASCSCSTTEQLQFVECLEANIDRSSVVMSIENKENVILDYSFEKAGTFVPAQQSRESALSKLDREPNDKLNVLFERCNVLQDMIDEKLSIFF